GGMFHAFDMKAFSLGHMRSPSSHSGLTRHITIIYFGSSRARIAAGPVLDPHATWRDSRLRCRSAREQWRTSRGFPNSSNSRPSIDRRRYPFDATESRALGQHCPATALLIWCPSSSQVWRDCKPRFKLLQDCHEKESIPKAAIQTALGRRLD